MGCCLNPSFRRELGSAERLIASQYRLTRCGPSSRRRPQIWHPSRFPPRFSNARSWHPTWRGQVPAGRAYGPARFGNYRKWRHAPVSTARAECLSSGSVAVTAVTSYPSGTPSFFGHRVIDLFCHETAVIQGRNFVVVGFSRHRGKS